MTNAPEARESKAAVWPAFAAFVGAFVVVNLLGIFGLLLLALIGAARGTLPRPTPGSGLDDHLLRVALSPAGILFAVTCSAVTLTLTAFAFSAFAKTHHTTRLSRLVSELRLGPSRSGFAFAFIGSWGTLALSMLSSSVVRELPFDGVALEALAKVLREAPRWMLVLLAIGVAGLAPIGEEVFFRGFIQTRLGRRWPRFVAIVVAAFLFGLFHMDKVQSIFAFFLGIYLGWLADRANSIRPAIAAHAFNNACAVLASAFSTAETEDAPLPIGVVVGAFVVVLGSIAAIRYLAAKDARALEAPSETGLSAVGQPQGATPPQEASHGVLNEVDANDR